MLAVLSPAKKLDFNPLGSIKDSLPAFQQEANELAAIAKGLSASQLQAMMKISSDLAHLNKKRFEAFAPKSTDQNSKQAAFAFAGDTYHGLDINSFSKDDLNYAQDHLRILSGLYGVLRPLDRIQPYRLEMGCKLQTNAGNTLYAYWGDRIGNALDQAANGMIINLASNEYFKSAGKAITSQIMTPAFKEERNGQFKMISFFAKKARGAMAGFMIKNRINQLNDLKEFNLDGYGYNRALSLENQWVFTRKSQE